MSETVIVLACTQSEFHDLVYEIGPTDDIYIFAGSKRRIDDVVADYVIDTPDFWRREDAFELYYFALTRVKGDEDGDRTAHTPAPRYTFNRTPPGGITILPFTIATTATTSPIETRIRAGEITGHRYWWVDTDSNLMSIVANKVWKPGEPMQGNLDDIFQDDLKGGIYSRKTPEYLYGEYGHLTEGPFPLVRDNNGHWGPSAIASLDPRFHTILMGCVKGTIKCWGEVMEHEYGYRAEFAKPASLDESYGPVDLQYLRYKYHV